MVLGPALGKSGEGFDNLYLRNDQTGALQALTTEAPKISSSEGSVEELFCLDYAGASEDGSRAFFAADGSYAGAPEAKSTKEFSLYEWSAGKGLAPLSVLPGKSVPVAPSPSTAFGATLVAAGHCQTGETVLRHVISMTGGSRFGPTCRNRERASYWPASTVKKRSSSTRRAGGIGSRRRRLFRAASADGSKAFFTARPAQKTRDAEGQLYLYEPAVGRSRTSPRRTNPEIEGVVGTQRRWLLRLLRRQGRAHRRRRKHRPREGVKRAPTISTSITKAKGSRFIAKLSRAPKSTQGDWSSAPSTLNARVTPDGRQPGVPVGRSTGALGL